MANIQGFTPQQALSRLIALRPRGIGVGDEVTGGGRSFKVIALQQWRMQGGSRSVGLVWGSRCPQCGVLWFQLTETRPTTLADECPACDVVGAKVAALDEALAEDLLCSAHPTGLKRRGRTETHVLDVIATLDPDTQTIPADELIAKAAELLPAPSEGKRDTRRQHVARAIQNLCKEKNSPIGRQEGVIIVYK